jgi:SHAQKYF class myb-like DNA-binding protein
MGEDYWGALQKDLPTKSVQDIKSRFTKLEEDVRHIENGLVPLPNYADDDDDEAVTAEVSFSFEPAKIVRAAPTAVMPPPSAVPATQTAKKSKSAPKTGEQERRKGVPWTEEEHKLFLLGLNKFGKGDWRSISRNFVISRTPTQVASHAQKYFIRLNSMNKKDNKRRSSIHDITSATGKD